MHKPLRNWCTHCPFNLNSFRSFPKNGSSLSCWWRWTLLVDQRGSALREPRRHSEFGHQGGAQRGALWLSDEREAQAAADVLMCSGGQWRWRCCFVSDSMNFNANECSTAHRTGDACIRGALGQWWAQSKEGALIDAPHQRPVGRFGRDTTCATGR